MTLIKGNFLINQEQKQDDLRVSESLIFCGSVEIAAFSVSFCLSAFTQGLPCRLIT